MLSFLIVAFGLDFYTEVLNLDYLLQRMNEDEFSKKYRKLSAALAGLIENYSLVWFATLNIQVRLVKAFISNMMICNTND